MTSECGCQELNRCANDVESFRKIIMIKIILILLLGVIIGKIHSYRKNRKQCLNCGSFNTDLICSVSGSGGGEYRYAVRHWEGYHCRNCNKGFSAKFKIDN